MRQVVYFQHTLGKPVDLPAIDDHAVETYMLEIKKNYTDDGHKVDLKTWPNGNITIDIFAEAALICSYTILKSD